MMVMKSDTYLINENVIISRTLIVMIMNMIIMKTLALVRRILNIMEMIEAITRINFEHV